VTDAAGVQADLRRLLSLIQTLDPTGTVAEIRRQAVAE
jgi:hypothetical protein